MNISRATIAATMILFLSGIGADNCGAYYPSASTSGGSMMPADTRPVCEADPPYGCLAICAAVGDVEFTSNCNAIGAGALTTQFKDDVAMQIQAAQEVGMELCTADMLFVIIAPCDVGIVPQQVVTSTACRNLPPDCAL